MEIEKIVGSNMRRIRERRLGISQEALGQRFEELGEKRWSRATVSAAESGNRAFSVADLVTIAQVLRVLPGALLVIPEDIESVKVGDREVSRDAIQLPFDAADSDSASARVSDLAQLAELILQDAQPLEAELASIARRLIDLGEPIRRLVDTADDLQTPALELRKLQLQYAQGSVTQVVTDEQIGESDE